MDKDMNKDDFMNDLYDYLWMPEEEQGAKDNIIRKYNCCTSSRFEHKHHVLEEI